VAVHKSFRSYVAQVVEVTVNGSDIKVDKVYCSVDCGLAINPDIVKTQIEGGIGFGLSAALHEKISIKKGIVEQLNFDEYELLRMNEMPEVEVNILTTADSPTGGIGEPGVPPLFPALLNAIEDSTGKRIRRLPIDLG
jgi:isoquinoline 1-oxidoreductase beta subunit